MRILTILIFFLLSNTLWGQQISMSVNKSKISTDETVKIEVRIDNIDNPNVQMPQLGDFAIVGGPNNYQSMQIVNGKTSQFKTISYILQPRKAGTFTIQPATVKHKGKTLKTKSLKLQVTQGKQKAQAGANQAKKPAATGGQTMQLPRGAKDYMFLVVQADTNSYYMGEQVTVNLNLYSIYDITNYQLSENPSFTGFWVQDLTPKRINSTRKMVNGQLYNVYPLKTYALFAQRSGEIDLDEVKAEITYRESVGGRGFFQQFRTRKINVRGKSEAIKVFPLPEKNKPDNFTGAVGKFGCSVRTDKRTCEVNEAITIDVNINGSGNLMLIEPSELAFPASFDAYEPEMNENIYERDSKITGSKKYQYVVVPTEEGTFTLPAVPFSYFDPEKQDYQTIDGRATKIVVKPSTNPELAKKTPKYEKDIADIDLTTSLSNKGSSAMVWMPILSMLYLAPFLIFPLAVKRRRKSEEAAKDVIGIKRREAIKKAQKRLETAKNHLNKNEKKPFYTETIQAIWGYIGDKLNLQTSDMSKENAKQLLQKEGINELLVSELISTIEYCEMAIYAPIPGADKLDNTYNNTLRIIADIEEGVQ